MQDKLCLVTGATAGIGKATCVGLAKLGAKVIVHARNPVKGEKAVKEIKEASGNSKVYLLCADFLSLREVRQMVRDFYIQFDKLDVLVNNAAAVYIEYGETQDGFERQWGINHLAPFLLSNLLLPALKKAPSARIVNVSSEAYERCKKINFEDLGYKQRYSSYSAYAQSKLANILFTYELTDRLVDSKITANALHPGRIASNIGVKNNNGWMSVAWKIVKPFLGSLEKGAQTSIYLASSPEMEGKSGGYYIKFKQIESSPISHDKALAQKLWEVSAEQVKLN